ncbi:putative ABC transport system permease protein [Marmoricola sp. OAE513]|uniref:ABC transporter permease n=1 Tax=Marmoricola sp. OAE513 TaxID=2817894 RepID=UPI001AE9D669
MSPVTGWRIPLRIARREALRAKGRSILMLVMIALPVMGVTAADILIQTQDVTSVESLDRRLGTEAAALVSNPGGGGTPWEQGLDPEAGGYGGGDSSQAKPGTKEPTLASVLATLGGERSGIELVDGYPSVKTDKGVTSASATTIDVSDPLARGLFRLTDGRWPKARDEVVVNRALADRGPGLGEDVEIGKGEFDGGDVDPEFVTRKVVGIAESTSYRDNPQVVGLPGSIPALEADDASWLVGGGPVSWEDVKKLNALGTLVVSRSVIENPSASALAADQMYNPDEGLNEETVTLAVLVVVMALIEVVLLAGPAFAVGARRQARPLALLAACGGTPGQARKVVLATGLVIGAAGAVVGTVLGIAAAAGFEPLFQQHNSTRFGPFQVPSLHLLGIAAFGLVSALLAAVVPAWIASRQDVVAVLNGRRGDQKPSTRSPYVGVALLVLGIVLAALSTEQGSSGAAIAIGLSAIFCVLGMVFVVPVVVIGLARLGQRLPLPLRFAVRDAARHRTRTTPAVAAVAATVMGVVALGIGVTSDDKRQDALYVPQLPGHAAAISSDGYPGKAPWDEYAAVVEREAPGVSTDPLLGVPVTSADGSGQELDITGSGPDDYLYGSYSSPFPTQVLVYDGTLPSVLTELDGFDDAVATRILDAGGAVVFPDAQPRLSQVTLKVVSYDGVEDGTADAPQDLAPPVTVSARAMDLRGRAPATAIISAEVAEKLGIKPATVALVTTGPQITRAQAKDIGEALKALEPGGSLYVERGYQQPSDVWVIQLVLAGLGALLMLGGTLTATFLALSDARPDLATLSAVGAAPRTRRFVAASYSLSIGLVGALLGAVVGFVPGIAATYAIAADGTSCTSQSCGGTAQAIRDHYLDVPWLLVLGVVVALPLLTAAVVGLSARSRLPMVSRLA